MAFRKGYKIILLFVDYLENGHDPSGVSLLFWGMWSIASYLTNLIVIFKNLIKNEITVNEECQTYQQKQFEIHG